MQDIADLIKKERIKQHLSTYKVAEMAGCSAQTVTYYETKQRKPRLDHIDQILKALKISIKIGFDDTEKGKI